MSVTADKSADDLRQVLLERLGASSKEPGGAKHSRGWLMRRFLLAADVLGLTLAFTATGLIFGSRGTPGSIDLGAEVVLFFLALPIWLLGAKLFGLYERDEERTQYSTADDLVRVFLLATVGIFVLTRVLLLARLADPDLTKLTVYWALIITCIPVARIGARIVARKQSAYIQNTVIVGANEVGQLVARKLLLHQEYGIKLLGFVSNRHEELRSDLGGLRILGDLDDLPEIVQHNHVERVVFAFPEDSYDRLVHQVRALRDSGVQVDIVPRLYEAIGPKHDVHTVEGMPLIGLAPVRIPRSSRMIKRSIDVAGATVGLVLAAPFFIAAAFLIKIDSRGPVFFRQTRVGKDMREFTLLKFRTMRVGVDQSKHRDYIAQTMSASATVGGNGCYKLERTEEITRVGCWLRRTSLDELPQLWNVLRGEMSLVGPRPCLAYEVEFFSPHHFDRFLVPAGLTGLWQVSARANSTFGEALDLDVLYAKSWSLGLDLSLLARTPVQLLRTGRTR
ncbi:MAG: sugar transferase [Gaiellaceae bacterium]|jgi:exopolysaccharide biosynthesis polyprenyl glycosylphosphotransferase